MRGAPGAPGGGRARPVTARPPSPVHPDSPLWSALAPLWPNRDASRVVEAGGLRWHVQVAGSGPALLLLHGTGAASHSWRGLLPLLARRWTVVAPDLPGHGFTDAPASPASLGIPGMAAAVAALLDALALSPRVIAAHSAGAAVAMRLTLDGSARPAAIVGVNAALSPPSAVYRALGAPLLHPVALSAGAARLAARVASSDWYMRRMLASTGSRVSPEQQALYAALTRSEPHVAALLAMLGHWDLAALARELPRVAAPVTLLAGTRDAWVPPRAQAAAARLLPNATVVPLAGLGHLAHEEAPALVAEHVERAAAAAGAPEAVGAAG